ncbi:MAG: LTA synthase family protein [Bacteroidetes bacterium]|nr:LTA synthase family protein [Bacteroidota bacterium]
MKFFSNLLILLLRLLLLLAIYQILRIGFLLFNPDYFVPSGIGHFLLIFFYGLRFDLSAIIFSNAFLILFHFMPPPWFYCRGYQAGLKIMFYCINIPFILMNCVDFEYFHYSMHRTTWDIFNVLTLGYDALNILPALLGDFWYILLILASVIFLCEMIYRKIDRIIIFLNLSQKEISPRVKPLWFRWIGILLIYPGVIGVCIIGARGGFQLRPVSIVDSAQSGNPQHSAFILNTSFTLIKTFRKRTLEEKLYFTEQKCREIFSIKYRFTNDSVKSSQIKNNIMVIILESFSKEYLQVGENNLRLVPFLDSISKKGLVFENAFSNGRSTIEGIPAIIASLPSLMEFPYITSIYSGNKIQSLPLILGQWGYETVFFHGGTNGTMGFDGFSKMTGFSHYFGRSEYNNDDHFDGTWGIYDDKFLSWCAGKLNEMKKPFFASLLTISSHHPYSLPPESVEKFKHIEDPMLRAVAYTDHSLRIFFNEMSKYAWFDSTLFIFTADHGGPAYLPVYQTMTGVYAIPMIFYKPNSDLQGVSTMTVQQADILPSVLDYLEYPYPFTSFGSSVFDTTGKHLAVNLSGNIYRLISDGYALFYSDSNETILYHYKSDSLLTRNIAVTEPGQTSNLKDLMKAVIQTFNNKMIHNKLTE